MFNKLTDRTSNGIPEMSQIDSAHACWISLLPQAQRVPPRQPEHLRSHQKIDTLGSNVHVCHRDCIFLIDEGNQVVDDRPVHNNSTCLCFPRLVPPLPELLPLLLEGLDLPADFLTLSAHRPEMSSLATTAALRIAESTSRFLVSSFATAGTR